MPVDIPALVVADAAAWRQWLLQNGAKSPGVWLSTARKGCTTPTSLTPDEALEEALCFGWINGQGRKGDETTICQRWTPRRPKGAWSKRNVGFIERLEKQGRMQEAGRAAVEAAKADGRWDAAYAGAANDDDLSDLLEALKEVPAAEQAWEAMNKTNRSAIYFRLMMLKTPAGRAKRVQAYVDMLAKGETPMPQKPTAKPVERPSKVTKSQKKFSTPEAATRQTRSGRRAPSYKDKD